MIYIEVSDRSGVKVKQSAMKMFVLRFLTSFIALFLLIGVGVFSYQMVMHFWEVPIETPIRSEIKEQEKEVITPVRLDDISKNLIYCIDDETGEIIKMTLEIYRCSEKKAYYITIPIRTQFTMSNSLYRRLVVISPAIPQVVKLSNITKYFNIETAYEYGCLWIEDLLKIDISFYTAIPEPLYQTMFTSSTSLNIEEQPLIPIEIFTESYMEYLKSLQTEEALGEYIEETYPKIQSNLSLYQKMFYLESYSGIHVSDITFELIEGMDKNSAYIIDDMKAKLQIAAYIAAEK